MNNILDIEKEIDSDEEAEIRTSKLPEWKNLLDKMKEEGLAFGKTYKIEWIHKELGIINPKNPTENFRLISSIGSINHEINPMGYQLSKQGQKGTGFITFPVQQSIGFCDAKVRAVKRGLKRVVTILSGILHNNNSCLTTHQAVLIEGKIERNAIRLALMQRPKTAVGLLKDKSKAEYTKEAGFKLLKDRYAK
jgi:hypothetical protein